MIAKSQMNMAVSVAAFAGVALATRALIYRYRPRKWLEGGQIKRLFIYPFKSLPPFEVTAAEVHKEGFAYKGFKDREFMLVDPDNDNQFITARAEPSLLLLEVIFDEKQSCLRIRSRNPEHEMEALEIHANRESDVDPTAILHVKTWEKDRLYKAHRCDETISTWFSKYLKKNVLVVRLLCLATTWSRDSPDRFQDTGPVSYLSEQSVDNLVDLIHDPSANITFRNFRSNILVDSKYPFEEDFWQRVKIGDVETEFQSRIPRCILTTINPDSGVKTNKEPLITLRKFRVDRSAEGILKYKHQPLLSSCHLVTKAGNIYVGQTILVEKAPRELL